MGKMNDEKFMWDAISEAGKAALVDEVPIGAVAVVDEKVVERAYNVREKTNDPLGHSEILLLQKISREKKSWRLEDVTIYVTCEPCLMCAGAMIQARIKRVVFGCFDIKGGAFGSLYDFSKDERLNHRIEVSGGILSDECAKLLKDFFKKLR